MVREHNDHFLPHNASLGKKSYQPLFSRQERITTHLGIIDVVYFIKDDKLDVSDEIRAFVKHTPQNLRGHDQTRGLRVNLYITCQDTDSGGGGRGAREGRFEVAEFLVREGLDR